MFQSAFAWHDAGHMVIAAIAYKRLTPRAKATVDALLRGGDSSSNDFINAACWADDTKNRSTARWHYIDVYFRADGRAAGLRPQPENVVWAIKRFSAVVGDKRATRTTRATALRYLIHFVGDIHQPLHCASRISDEFPDGDRGGNAYKIRPPGGMASRPRNLHFLWDAGGGLFDEVMRPLDAQGLKKIGGIATLLTARYDSSATIAMRNLNADSWAREGERICENAVYQLEVGAVPSDAYLETVQDVSGRRVVIAGCRLAAILNKLLD